jgi:myo-inositol-1(or 4)-monophosphatase
MRKHDGQIRKGSSLPYITHPVSVYAIVKKYKESKNIEAILCAAILHDVIEDCGVTYFQIFQEFGPMTAGLVQELSNDESEIERVGKEEYINQKLLSLSNYGLVIKLADMLDNASDLPESKMTERIKRNLSHLIEHRALTHTQQRIYDQLQILFEEFQDAQG